MEIHNHAQRSEACPLCVPTSCCSTADYLNRPWPCVSFYYEIMSVRLIADRSLSCPTEPRSSTTAARSDLCDSLDAPRQCRWKDVAIPRLNQETRRSMSKGLLAVRRRHAIWRALSDCRIAVDRSQCHVPRVLQLPSQHTADHARELCCFSPCSRLRRQPELLAPPLQLTDFELPSLSLLRTRICLRQER